MSRACAATAGPRYGRWAGTGVAGGPSTRGGPSARGVEWSWAAGASRPWWAAVVRYLSPSWAMCGVRSDVAGPVPWLERSVKATGVMCWAASSTWATVVGVVYRAAFSTWVAVVGVCGAGLGQTLLSGLLFLGWPLVLLHPAAAFCLARKSPSSRFAATTKKTSSGSRRRSAIIAGKRRNISPKVLIQDPMKIRLRLLPVPETRIGNLTMYIPSCGLLSLSYQKPSLCEIFEHTMPAFMESFQSSNRMVPDFTRSSMREPERISRNAPEWFTGVYNSPSSSSLSSSNSDRLEMASLRPIGQFHRRHH
ncbi:hypothetical protein M9H77_12402 [Catharanthus roseus]|uniref:Uncharacterized protein n=1 Tax=Catharanthus roseus TaxID=4058 RepID=A0ACC0BHH2_CATRO|nr:hypothetical protein M9H77_12402 [Catharanthus roseus]